MKMYVLIYLENSDNGCNAEAFSFLDDAQAAAKMREAYEKALKSTEFDVDEQADDHYCHACDTEAVIVDGLDSYSWRIEEHELDVRTAIEVKGGLVQNVYANADISTDVYDLDVSDFPDEGEADAVDVRATELEALVKEPGWRNVW